MDNSYFGKNCPFEKYFIKAKNMPFEKSNYLLGQTMNALPWQSYSDSLKNNS